MAQDEKRRDFIKRGFGFMLAQALRLPAINQGDIDSGLIEPRMAEYPDLSFLARLFDNDIKIEIEARMLTREKNPLPASRKIPLLREEFEDCRNFAKGTPSYETLNSWRNMTRDSTIKNHVITSLNNSDAVARKLVELGYGTNSDEVSAKLCEAKRFLEMSEEGFKSEVVRTIELIEPKLEEIIKRVEVSRPEFANIIRAGQQLTYYTGEFGTKLHNFKITDRKNKWRIEGWEISPELKQR